MNRSVKQYQSKEIHVVLDNLSTHKPNRDLPLTRRKNFHSDCTSTHTSWFKQIQIWSSIPSSKSPKRGSFGSVAWLVAQIDSFIGSYNEKARSFVWTRVSSIRRGSSRV